VRDPGFYKTTRRADRRLIPSHVSEPFSRRGLTKGGDREGVGSTVNGGRPIPFTLVRSTYLQNLGQKQKDKKAKKSQMEASTPPSFDSKPCPHGYTHCVPCSDLRSTILAAFPLQKEWIQPAVRFPQRNHIVYAVSLDLRSFQTTWRTRAVVEASGDQQSRAAWLEVLQDVYAPLANAQNVLLDAMRRLHRDDRATPTASSYWSRLGGGKS